LERSDGKGKLKGPVEDDSLEKEYEVKGRGKGFGTSGWSRGRGRRQLEQEKLIPELGRGRKRAAN